MVFLMQGTGDGLIRLVFWILSTKNGASDRKKKHGHETIDKFLIYVQFLSLSTQISITKVHPIP